MATSTTQVSKTPPTAEAVAPKGRLKSILLKLFLVLVIAVAALCIFIQQRPADFAVSRSTVMKATPAAVFEQVNDFHKWDAWSPWAKMDPNAKTTFEGPASGEGAKFSWVGNSNIGEGNMTIVESRPNEGVRIRLEFVKPFAGTSTAEMKIEPQGDETKLTWSMYGKNSFMAKAVGLFMDCDKMIGDKFDEGLSSMKKIVEAEPAKPAAAEPAQPNNS